MGYPGDFLGPVRPDDRHDRPAGDPPGRSDSWIPIRSLAPRHRRRILDHLLALDASDRYLRFGHAAADSHIARYADRIDFGKDEVFGIFNRRLQLVALAHLACLDQGRSAEFGVSVLQRWRGRGFGARLFARAVLHARNRGVDTLVIHALGENRAMLKIARDAGATLHREGGDAEAELRLPPEDLASRVGQLMEDRAAEFDYQLKRQARRMDAWMAAMAEVRDRLVQTWGGPRN